MVEIGKINQLRVVKELEFGLYLDGGEGGEILLPRRFRPEGYRLGELLPVFICFDASGRLIASSQMPLACVGEVASLKVVTVTPSGAILDWGIPCELLAPLRDQRNLMRKGKSYSVFVYYEAESNRILASSDLNNFLDRQPHGFQGGEEVELYIDSETDLGYKAVVNHAYWGVLYKNELFQELRPGQRLPGYIKKVRGDGKLDLTTHKPGLERVDDLAGRILALLRERGGFLPLTDSTPPERIYEWVGESKKTYKKAIGLLFKQRQIVIASDGIRLPESGGE